jgi:subtilisin-like proprotein convertase family protein
MAASGRLSHRRFILRFASSHEEHLAMGTVTGEITVQSPFPSGIVSGKAFSTITGVPDGAVILKITVSLSIFHTNVQDLGIRLADPNLALIDLSVFEGGTDDNYTDTVFDDDAATSIVGATAPFTGTFRPEESFASLFPGDINGQWALMIQDSGGTGGGSLGEAALTIIYNAPATAIALNDRLGWIAENSSTATRTKVADIDIADDGEGTNALTLIGADAASFEIVGGDLYLKAGVVLDFESKASYSVAVRVSDPALGAGFAKTSSTLTLDVIDVGGEPHQGTATSDTLTGTALPDGFVFDTPLDRESNVDVLVGFDPADDRLELDNAIFRKLKTDGPLKAKFFNIGKRADDKNDFINYNKASGAVTYDKNGDRKGGDVKFAVLLGGPDDVGAGNFVVI